ncbi:RIIa domain-containing protein 1-like [Symsagittifera roscoffensis]|uniref:RIIa domain-containing protein 1-like n=1 Tax=Symsagittifera roscoffensis TaxID=84072 RepID=UPI00307C0178
MAAPQHEAPVGMDRYDYFALNEQQQEKLNEHKVATRIANEHYLRQHPELDCLLKKLINKVLTDRPDNIHEYCADFFSPSSSTLDQLADELSEEVGQVQRQHSHVEELAAVAQTLPPEELIYNEVK